KTLLTRRRPLFVTEHLKTGGITNPLQTERLPIRMKPMERNELGHRIITRPDCNDEVIGYLGASETEVRLGAAHLTVLTRLSTFISKLLYQKQYAEQENDHDVQSVIWKIINNDYLNESQVKNEARRVNLSIPEQFTVVVGSVTDALYLDLLEKVKNV